MEELTLSTAKTVDKVEELIRNGADVNYKKHVYSWTPLMTACHNDRTEIAKCLILNGADINLSDNTGETAVEFATNNGNGELVYFILERLDQEIMIDFVEKCLVKSCMSGHCDIFDRLIGLVNITNPKFLENACYFGQIDIVDRLLQLGANVNAGISREQDSPLIYACKSHNNSLAIVDRLICFGADFNFQGEDNETALMHAARNISSEDVVVRLISVGCDLDLRNNNGDTALIITAKHYHQVKIIKLLLDAGADREIMNNEGKTASSYCFKDGESENLFK